MLMMINIPDKEFGIDITDKFQDFFERLRAETKAHMISGTNLVCGAYELETIDMFQEAFKKSLILSVSYDRAEAIIKQIGGKNET